MGTRWAQRGNERVCVLENELKLQARNLGFALVGIASAAPADGFDRLTEWLDRGYCGDMEYLRKHPELRREPTSILPTVRSVVMVGMNYGSEEGTEIGSGQGRVARMRKGRTIIRFSGENSTSCQRG